jgi:Fe-S-cluster containining protein
MNLDQFAKEARLAQKENRKQFDRLRKKPPSDLDEVVHSLHEKAFDHLDCLSCGNCCKTTSPIFYPKDIERAAKAVRLKPGDFVEKYLHVDEDKDYVLNAAPCPFLGADNYCGIYDDRPTACREYPHTNRKKIHQILELTFQNTMVCPAVLEISQKLKQHYK